MKEHSTTAGTLRAIDKATTEAFAALVEAQYRAAIAIAAATTKCALEFYEARAKTNLETRILRTQRALLSAARNPPPSAHPLDETPR